MYIPSDQNQIEEMYQQCKWYKSYGFIIQEVSQLNFDFKRESLLCSCLKEYFIDGVKDTGNVDLPILPGKSVVKD
jgi:hypothetical protein